MDLTSLAVAFVGGGASGALIAGYISVRTQRKQHEHDDRHRFAPDKREMYAQFLHESGDHVQALLHQRAVGYDIPRGKAKTGDLPPLGTSQRLRWLTEEIAILSAAVRPSAEQVLVAVVQLDAFAVDTRVPGMNLGSETMLPLGSAIQNYEAARKAFMEAATIDLGTAIEGRRRGR